MLEEGVENIGACRLSGLVDVKSNQVNGHVHRRILSFVTDHARAIGSSYMLTSQTHTLAKYNCQRRQSVQISGPV